MLRIAPSVPRRGVVNSGMRSLPAGEQTGRSRSQDGRKTRADVPEVGLTLFTLPAKVDPIRHLAGLLTLASSNWLPSQPFGQWRGGQLSTITVAGPCRIFTGFPFELNAAPEANCYL
jgi:hypothetical protein